MNPSRPSFEASSSRPSQPRWRPTVEQIHMLEDIYRYSGGRIPGMSDICRILPHLQVFGPVEARNIYFWFSNRKGRERSAGEGSSRRVTVPLAGPQSISLPVTASEASAAPMPRFGTPPMVDISTVVSLSRECKDPVLITSVGVYDDTTLNRHVQQIYQAIRHLTQLYQDAGTSTTPVPSGSNFPSREVVVARENMQTMSLFENGHGSVIGEDLPQVGPNIEVDPEHSEIDLELRLGPPFN